MNLRIDKNTKLVSQVCNCGSPLVRVPCPYCEGHIVCERTELVCTRCDRSEDEDPV